MPVIANFSNGASRTGRSLRASFSGINVSVSEADFGNLKQQITDAVEFLAREAAEIRRLVAFPGVEAVTLDFGVMRRPVAAQTDTFPAELVSVAGSLGLGITVSQYEVAEP